MYNFSSFRSHEGFLACPVLFSKKWTFFIFDVIIWIELAEELLELFHCRFFSRHGIFFRSSVLLVEMKNPRHDVKHVFTFCSITSVESKVEFSLERVPLMICEAEDTQVPLHSNSTTTSNWAANFDECN